MAELVWNSGTSDLILFMVPSAFLLSLFAEVILGKSFTFGEFVLPITDERSFGDTVFDPHDLEQITCSFGPSFSINKMEKLG